jgi:hypothetical protein
MMVSSTVRTPPHRFSVSASIAISEWSAPLRVANCQHAWVRPTPPPRSHSFASPFNPFIKACPARSAVPGSVLPATNARRFVIGQLAGAACPRGVLVRLSFGTSRRLGRLGARPPAACRPTLPLAAHLVEFDLHSVLLHGIVTRSLATCRTSRLLACRSYARRRADNIAAGKERLPEKRVFSSTRHSPLPSKSASILRPPSIVGCAMQALPPPSEAPFSRGSHVRKAPPVQPHSQPAPAVPRYPGRRAPLGLGGSA